MKSYQLENIHVVPGKNDFQEFSKVCYPIRCDRFSEIQMSDSRHADYGTLAMIVFTAHIFSCYEDKPSALIIN